MYLRSFKATDLKCFRSVEFELPDEGGLAGWNVILGGNGAGKTSLLQAVALTLLGKGQVERFVNAAGWVRAGKDRATCEATLERSSGDQQAGGQPRKRPYAARFALLAAPQKVGEQVHAAGEIVLLEHALALYNGPYSGKPGWFSAGYGPFRRLSGASGEGDIDLSSRAARHETLFRETAALTRCEAWLISLYSQSIDPAHPDSARAIARLELAQQALNRLLPDQVQLAKVTSRHVELRNTISGATVRLSQLSDGYRSFLSLAIDLLRHLLDGADAHVDGGRVMAEGIVLIDEIDTHLHPRWQREIGPRLCEVFPRLQFIVTTHSPFVAQTARPRGLFMLEQDGEAVTITRPMESVRGMRADQILTSPLFDLLSTRDLETERAIRRRDELLNASALDPKAEGELQRLDEELQALVGPPGDTFAEMQRYARLREELAEDLALLEEP